MAFGVPCIVGRDGGPAELVDDGGTGCVVDGNDAEAIAAALYSLVTDARRRSAMGIRARAWAEASLDWGRHARAALLGGSEKVA